MYKRIIRTANAYYNVGLSRAQVRDLTGAVDALSRCLELNKRHVEARNLLGLVYNEMGETVLALREWVLSRSYRAQSNPAERYIRDVQANQNHFELQMQGVEKYNQAVHQAQTGGADLAMVTLKRVVQTNPNLLRAHLLLALLYMQEKSYSKAGKLLTHVLMIDRGNATARRYQQAIRELQHKAPETVDPVEKNLRQTARAEVVIPAYGVAASSYLLNALYVLIGVAIGILALYFLVIPGKEKEYAASAQQQINEINSEILSRDAQIAELQRTIEALEQDKADIQGTVDDMNTASNEAADARNKMVAAYDKALNLALIYAAGDIATVAEQYPNYTPELVDSDSYRQFYNYIYVQNFEYLYASCFNEGQRRANEGFELEFGVRLLEAARVLKPDSSEAIFWEGVAYHRIGDLGKARELYQKVIDEYPNSAEAPQAVAQIAQIP